MSDEEVARKISNAILTDREFKRALEYAAKGRRFAGLSDDELKTQWIDAYKEWVHDLKNEAKQIKEDDLLAEMTLRKIEPPIEEVEAEQEILAAEAARVLDDPEAYKRLFESIKADLPGILGISKPKN
jgi:hypothetical protein